jgi:putative transposase
MALVRRHPEAGLLHHSDRGSQYTSSSYQAQLSIFEYIKVFYNRRRRHSTLGYLSPVIYEQQLNG